MEDRPAKPHLCLHPDFPHQKALADERLRYITFMNVAQYLKAKFSVTLQDMKPLHTNGVINYTYILTIAPSEYNSLPRKCLLRIGNTHPFWARIKTQNEVALLRFLGQHTTLPLPKVLDFSADTSTSPLHAEFILMNYVENDMDLCDYIVKLSAEYQSESANKETIVERLCELLQEGYRYVNQMLEVEFTGAREYICAVDLDLSPVRMTWDGASVGPCKTVSEFLTECLEGTLVNYRYRMHSETDQETKRLFEELLPGLEMALSDIKQMSKREPNSSYFYLRHADLHAGNINVLNGHIVGIFDWEHARLEPVFEDSDEFNLAKLWFEGNTAEELYKVLCERQKGIKEAYQLVKFQRPEWNQFKEYRHLVDHANWSWFYVQSWWSRCEEYSWQDLVRNETRSGLQGLKEKLRVLGYL